ncbi:conserved Plasmodium protein, unknown function [Plasmodium ovale]|uniref:Tetratricopeptide repeat protein n=1 Tax=Plasmodium ovale TaxID=36330 RepID=A0A1D3KXR4_PLAOA|nr:conserved Plasmodium protein, unknown function [Plasmodium ovale]
MEYKEKPDGPFFVSFYVTNFSASDESTLYRIKVTDFYNNYHESNDIHKSNLRQINFSSNYIEINEESAINDIVENSIKIEVFAKTNRTEGDRESVEGGTDYEGNFICIGSDDIRTFPFLHDQLIITKNVIVSYKYDEKKECSNGPSAEKRKNEKEEKKKKKRQDRNKSGTKKEADTQEDCIKRDINISFYITLNINSLVGSYCGRAAYNIMNVQVDGVFNIPASLDDKLQRKSSISFQLKFLDFCLNDGILVEDEDNDTYKITWRKNSMYKYRNMKETEYIYNFLFGKSFNVNAYILCISESKKQKENASPNVLDFLCARFEVNIADVIANRVVSAKYKLHTLNDTKKETKSDYENGVREDELAYSDAYVLLTVQFYKPFLQRPPMDILKLDYFKNENIIKSGEKEDTKEEESISCMFNRLILDGIEFVNGEIGKLKNEDQLKIYRKSKNYFSFLNSLKERPTYIHLYNNIKNVMIRIAYEIVNKKVYKNFNLHHGVTCNGDDKEKDEGEKEKDEGEDEKDISEENINCIYAYLFNHVYESSNIIVNNYFEKEEELSSNAIDDIKKKNNINNMENYLYNIILENEYLLKGKKNELFFEALLVLLFKKVNKLYCNKKRENMHILENQNDNHVINIIENYTEYEEKYNGKSTNEDNYVYKKRENKNNINSHSDSLNTLINAICTKNNTANNYNSYLFDYIKNFEHIILRDDKKTPQKEEPFRVNHQQENLISILNDEHNKQLKSLFTDIIYKYAKSLLVINNGGNSSNKKKVQQELYANYRHEGKNGNTTSDGNPVVVANSPEHAESYDNFEYHENFNSYEKYINGEKMESCVSCLSTYIELTNCENVESIFILSLVYLNMHKYDETLKIVGYLIEILKRREKKKKKKKKKRADNIKEEDEMGMKNLHLYSTFNYNELHVSEEICVYIKALCYFFQHNYIYYYTNMCILLNTNENKLKQEIERNLSFFQEGQEKYKKGECTNKGSKKEETVPRGEKKKKNSSKKKKIDYKSVRKYAIDVAGEQTDETEANMRDLENDKQGSAKESIDIKASVPTSVCADEEGKPIPFLNNDTMNYPEIHMDDVPLRDKFLMLFLIYCLKFNVLNIFMFIHENKKRFFTNVSLNTSLYRQLVIRAFFSLQDYAKCVRLIEEMEEHLHNMDMLYVYAQSLYKLRAHMKSISQFNNYLNLCMYGNVRAKIYLQLSKMYISLNQYENCKTFIKKSLQIRKTSYAYLLLSYYYLKKKKYLHAYKLLYKSNEVSFMNSKLWAYLCITFLNLNMKNEADKSLSNFVKMKRYNEETINNLIAAYQEHGYSLEEPHLSALCEAARKSLPVLNK